jgi:probable rRNA maturation factor
MRLEITKFVKNERVYQDFLEEWFDLCLKNLAKEQKLKNSSILKSMELSIVFVDESKIKKLNKKYRNVNKSTDVLSFDGDGFVSMGELIFCMDVIKFKAKSSRLSSKLYLGMLMLHGILHLLGYEHEQGGRDETDMFNLQDKILRKVASKLAPDHKKDFDVG